MESFDRLGVGGSNFIDQSTTSDVGARDGGSVARKGAVTERMFQIVSVTTEFAISKIVSRFTLQVWTARN